MSDETGQSSDGTYRRFAGDDWEHGDPYVGYDVPKQVRKGGATCPVEKDESGGGTIYRSHSAYFECQECGEVRRFATSQFVTSYRCSGCSDVRWFEFKWELNQSTEPGNEREEKR